MSRAVAAFESAASRLAVFSLAALGVAAGLLLSACDASLLATEPPGICTEPGAQCQLPTGPLGVCERSQCPSGVSSPCLECISQH